MNHAAIIPLIGGEALASAEVFGSRPDYILSYSAFKNNDSHLLNYWNHEVPYYLLDEGQKHPHKVDVVSSVCPCAGLSMMSHGYGDQNENNKWMIESSEYVLGQMQPTVLWGENAPGLIGKIGTTVRNQLINIGRKYGYTMTLYKTKSLLHGVPQVRDRTFYFFWKGNKTPLLHYYNTPYTKIEDLILGVNSNFQMEPINKNKPSQDPYYRYLLEVVYGGITHREHFNRIDPNNISVRSYDAKSLIETFGHDYKQVGQWMQENGYDREVSKCDRMYNKLKDGGNIMRRGTIVPKEYIGAFVGHYPTMLTHPHEDRYITYREAMTIMGLPSDFELLNPSKNFNHICQNVPYNTARDMAIEVKAALSGERNYVDSRLIYQYNNNQTHVLEASNDLSEFFEVA
jgi:site-specific DNA-cytosine methylase